MEKEDGAFACASENGHQAGLTKFEFIAITITASLATDIRANPKDVVKKAIEHTKELFKQLEEENK
jgi:flagellar motor component MotA